MVVQTVFVMDSQESCCFRPPGRPSPLELDVPGTIISPGGPDGGVTGSRTKATRIDRDRGTVIGTRGVGGGGTSADDTVGTRNFTPQGATEEEGLTVGHVWTTSLVTEPVTLSGGQVVVIFTRVTPLYRLTFATQEGLLPTSLSSRLVHRRTRPRTAATLPTTNGRHSRSTFPDVSTRSTHLTPGSTTKNTGPTRTDSTRGSPRSVRVEKAEKSFVLRGLSRGNDRSHRSQRPPTRTPDSRS